MEGKHDIVAPIFKTKNSVVNKEEFIPLRRSVLPQTR